MCGDFKINKKLECLAMIFSLNYKKKKTAINFLFEGLLLVDFVKDFDNQDSLQHSMQNQLN